MLPSRIAKRSAVSPRPVTKMITNLIVLLGSSNQARLLVVTFAERPPRTRIISARLANARERQRYEEDL